MHIVRRMMLARSPLPLLSATHCVCMRSENIFFYGFKEDKEDKKLAYQVKSTSTFHDSTSPFPLALCMCAIV